jgi:hypothetical protein
MRSRPRVDPRPRMTEYRKLRPAEETIPEPLSPELVLVDPQLANLARKSLRVVGDSAARGRRAVAPASQQEPSEGRADGRGAGDEYPVRLASERLAVARAALGSHDDRVDTLSVAPESEVEFRPIPRDYADDERSRARARPRRRGVVAAALAALAVVAAGFSILRLVQNESDAGYSGNGRVSTPTESMPVQRTGEARQNRRTREPPRATGTSTLNATKPVVPPKKRPQPVQPSEFPTRVFVWPAVSRATFYKVEFFRRGRKIFDASPTMPRIELPLRWVFRGRHFRLTPATYRWEVRAAFGPRSRPRYGQPITRSTWTAR